MAERAKIVKEANDKAQSIITEAKDKAKAEVQKVKDDAMAEIASQKLAAVTEVKNMLGQATVELATKVLSRELSDEKAQQDYISQEVSKISLN